MLDRATIAALAAELHDAQRRRVQVRHFSMRHPGMTIDDGYAIQREWLKTRLAEGRVVKGRKIGLTSRAMQQASQIDEPDFAPLLDDMFFAPGAIPFDRFIAGDSRAIDAAARTPSSAVTNGAPKRILMIVASSSARGRSGSSWRIRSGASPGHAPASRARPRSRRPSCVRRNPAASGRSGRRC